MDIFKAFVLNNTTHEVNILWKDAQAFFRANQIAKILGLTNIHATLKSFDDTEKVINKVSSLGGDQETMFLTEDGLYRLLMISRRPEAKPFQKWVCQVIRTIRETGRYELDRLVEKGIQEALAVEAARHRLEVDQVRHTSLLEAFRDRPVVYFGKIRDEEDGRTLLKIGSTNNLSQRVGDLQKKFGSMFFFHIIESPHHRKFEEYLQKHPRISCCCFREVVYDGHRSHHEVFLMSNQEIQGMLAIAKNNTFRFATDLIAHRTLEALRLKKEAYENLRIAKELSLQLLTQEREIMETDMSDVGEDLRLVHYERRYTQARGPKIQRYSPDGKNLIVTYPGTAEATRDTTLAAPSGKGIRDAISRRSVYKGFRWAALPRNLPDETFQDIGESVATPTLHKGFVAMLSLDRSQIVRVFCDQKAASQDRQFKNGAAISAAIKNGTKSGGHYFQMWHDVNPSLQQQYLAHHSLPEKRVAVNARPIEKVHPVTGAVVQRFASAADIAKTARIARASLHVALEQGSLLKGHLWRYAIDTPMKFPV